MIFCAVSELKQPSKSSGVLALTWSSSKVLCCSVTALTERRLTWGRQLALQRQTSLKILNDAWGLQSLQSFAVTHYNAPACSHYPPKKHLLSSLRIRKKDLFYWLEQSQYASVLNAAVQVKTVQQYSGKGLSKFLEGQSTHATAERACNLYLETVHIDTRG